MQYSNVIPGRFVSRPNRFLAQVETADGVQTCHVKNTGRCAELLLPGAPVWLQRFGADAKRKTKFDLIAVQKGALLLNIDSQAPNAAAPGISGLRRVRLDSQRTAPRIHLGRFPF